MLLAILFVLGAHVGSFLNVCIWRLPRGESVAQPPSHCPSCDTRLRAWDMVPILSQTLLRARCRYCGNKISWRYAYIEALTGVLFALAGLRPGSIQGGYITGIWAGDPVILLRDLLVISCLVVVFWIDYETLMIPLSSALLIGLAGVGADAWGVWNGSKPLTTAPLGFFDALPAALPESIVAMAVAAAIIWAVRAGASWLYGREAMGFGDVFLVAAIAANIGWSASLLTFFFLSATLGAFIGLALRVPHSIRAYRRGKVRDVRRKGKKPLAGALARRAFRLEMPFGPMLAVGAFVTILWGTPLNEAYMNWASPPPLAQRKVRSNSTLLTHRDAVVLPRHANGSKTSERGNTNG